MRVAAFGDASLASALARGVLGGHHSEVGHQLAGMTEAGHIAQFACHHHRGYHLETLEPLDDLNLRAPAPIRQADA